VVSRIQNVKYDVQHTITSAVVSAVAKEVRVGEVGTNLFGCGPEIIQALRLVGKNVTSRDEDVVGVDTLPSIWHPKRMVQCKRCFCVGKAIKVPVCLQRSAEVTSGSDFEHSRARKA
jgi:hypothetical protein